MTRRGLFAAPLALAGCGRRGPSRENLLPAAIGPQWRRTSLGGVATAPEPLTAAAVKRAQSAGYEGPGKLEVLLFELSSSAAALDAVQRWRPEARGVVFYKDEFFVVVRYEEGTDRPALNAFVRELSRHLGSGAKA